MGNGNALTSERCDDVSVSPLGPQNPAKSLEHTRY